MARLLCFLSRNGSYFACCSNQRKSTYMGDFNRGGGKRFGGGHGGGFAGRSGGRDGGRPSFPLRDRGGFGDRDRGSVTMYQATCDQCGKPCEVPFRPVEGRPVFCTTCFGNKREGGDSRGGDCFPQRSFNDSKTITRTDFGGFVGRENCDEVKKQLELLNGKMDRLVKAMEMMAHPAPAAKPAVVEEKVRETIRAAINPQPAVATDPTPAIKSVSAAKSAKTKKVFKKGKK